MQQLTRYENEDFLSNQKVFLKRLGVDVLFDVLEVASFSLREEIIKQMLNILSKPHHPGITLFLLNVTERL